MIVHHERYTPTRETTDINTYIVNIFFSFIIVNIKLNEMVTITEILWGENNTFIFKYI